MPWVRNYSLRTVRAISFVTNLSHTFHYLSTNYVLWLKSILKLVGQKFSYLSNRDCQVSYKLISDLLFAIIP